MAYSGFAILSCRYRNFLSQSHGNGFAGFVRNLKQDKSLSVYRPGNIAIMKRTGYQGKIGTDFVCMLPSTDAEFKSLDLHAHFSGFSQLKVDDSFIKDGVIDDESKCKIYIEALASLKIVKGYNEIVMAFYDANCAHAFNLILEQTKKEKKANTNPSALALSVAMENIIVKHIINWVRRVICYPPTTLQPSPPYAPLQPVPAVVSHALTPTLS